MYPQVSQLATRVAPLDLSDSIGKAADLLRSSSGRSAPVGVNGHVMGVVTAEDLVAPLARDPEQARKMPIASLALRPAHGIPDYWTVDRALAHFRQEGLESAPVLDAAGRYVGMVSTADLATALCGRLRPRSIGGMATPFGVYLTDGVIRGGVGDVALVSAGAFMASMIIVAVALATLAVGEAGWLMHLPWIATLVEKVGGGTLQGLVVFLLFASSFRLTRVSGFHAAEHQVVHAIEAGDDLSPAVVRSKPRVHPRCGTNLVVGMLLIMGLWHWVWLRDLPLGPILGIIFFRATWRRLGSAAQRYVTTRPATDGEIESGIRAGEELLARYQGRPLRPLAMPARLARRVWNMGLCQVAAGFILLMGTAYLINYFVRIPGLDGLFG